MKKSNLFIIGAPKCGTTAMAHYLGQHPQIFFSKIKEPHYFNTDSGHRYFFSEKKYLTLFSESNDNEKYLAEGSVWYLYSNIAVDNILKFNPDSKFIVMLRNPVDLFFSLHQELLFGGSEDVSSPLKAWNLQEKRLLGKNIPLGCSDIRFLQYGESCSLGKQIKKLITKIDKNKIKFIILDDLKKDSNKVFQSVLVFLGLDKYVLKNYEVINQKKVRRLFFLSNILKYIQFFKQKIGIKIGFGIANKLNKLNVKEGLALSSEEDINNLKPILKEFFKKDILLLEKITNLDLTSWK